MSLPLAGLSTVGTTAFPDIPVLPLILAYLLVAVQNLVVEYNDLHLKIVSVLCGTNKMNSGGNRFPGYKNAKSTDTTHSSGNVC